MSLGEQLPGAVGGWLPGKVLGRGALAAGGQEIWTGRGRRRKAGLGEGDAPSGSLHHLPHPLLTPRRAFQRRAFCLFLLRSR